MRSLLLLAGVLGLPLGACSVFESKECTDELRVHSIEVTRDVATAGAPEMLGIEACVDGKCTTATPDASGAFSFGNSLAISQGAVSGTMAASSDPAKVTLKVRFSVMEQAADSTTQLVVRVKKGDAQLSEDRAAVQWSDDECHPAPNTTNP
jgi:hypothetical protein